MSDKKRKYRKSKRAEAEAQTRRRITESAVELHGTLGPSRTTFSAVAELAGVRRSTVYRHFPDESALFAACSAHWSSLNPPPNPAPWNEIADPGERLQTALGEIYEYYGRTEQMLSRILRDEELPVVKQSLSAYYAYMDAVRAMLIRGWDAAEGASRRLEAVVGHALSFGTWQSLIQDQELATGEAAEVMCALATYSAGRSAGGTAPREIVALD